MSRPRPVFGKVRVPVKVTLNGDTYPSTIASMGNGPCLPLRRSNREAAGLEGTETLSATLTLDAAKGEIRPPADFTRALKTKAGAWERFRKLSYSHQREHVEAIEGAKKPETRARRIVLAVRDIRSRASSQGVTGVSGTPSLRSSCPHSRSTVIHMILCVRVKPLLDAVSGAAAEASD